MPESSLIATPSSEASSLQSLARVFNIASSPLRLHFILMLASGARSVAQLHEELGGEKRLIHQHLSSLEQGKLIRSHRRGKVRSFDLTEDGARLLRAMGVVSGSPDDRMPGKPSTQPPTPDSGDSSRTVTHLQGEDPLANLVRLLKTFADPVRLRILNLLASPHEVCVCHIHEALELPQSTVSRHLTNLKEAGLITGRRKGTWVYYRLVRPTDDLGRVLASQFGHGVSNLNAFRKDRQKLAGFQTCSTSGDAKVRQRP